MSFPEFGPPVSSPFVIVIFDGQWIIDRNLLRLFGFKIVGKYSRQSTNSVPTAEITIADGPSWKAISSDWSYCLWHHQSTRPTLWRLSKLCNILAYSVGDSDDAHSIHMFTEAELSREFVVADRHGGGAQEVLFDSGDRLPGETEELCSSPDLHEYLRSVAKTNGFDPESATRVKKWTVVDDSVQSELVAAEQALLRTSWEHYRA